MAGYIEYYNLGYIWFILQLGKLIKVGSGLGEPKLANFSRGGGGAVVNTLKMHYTVALGSLSAHGNGYWQCLKNDEYSFSKKQPSAILCLASCIGYFKRFLIHIVSKSCKSFGFRDCFIEYCNLESCKGFSKTFFLLTDFKVIKPLYIIFKKNVFPVSVPLLKEYKLYYAFTQTNNKCLLLSTPCIVKKKIK